MRIKLKLIAISGFLTLMLSSAFGQPFYSVSNGPNQYINCIYSDTSINLLYVGGQFNMSGNIVCKQFAKWDYIGWDSLRNNLGGSPQTIIKYNNELYFGGGFSRFDTILGQWAPYSSLIKWDSTNQDFVAAYPKPKGNVNTLREYGGDLYIMGNFDSIEGVAASKIARYNGITVFGYPPIGNPVGANFHDCIYYNNELYVGGNFNFQTFNGLNDLAKWNGTQWITVGGGLSGSVTWVNSLIEYQGMLIIGGSFSTAWGDPGNGIVGWDGSQWHQLGSGVNGGVTSMTVYEGELWVGGGFTDAGGITVSNLAKWDGNQWTNPGISLNLTIKNFEQVGSELFMAGSFYAIVGNGDTAKFIMRYNSVTGFSAIEISAFNFEIHPNPAENTTTISFVLPPNIKAAAILIYDLGGRLMEKTELDIYSRERMLDISSLASGSYQLVLQPTGMKGVVRKLVIMR